MSPVASRNGLRVELQHVFIGCRRRSPGSVAVGQVQRLLLGQQGRRDVRPRERTRPCHSLGGSRETDGVRACCPGGSPLSKNVRAARVYGYQTTLSDTTE